MEPFECIPGGPGPAVRGTSFPSESLRIGGAEFCSLWETGVKGEQLSRAFWNKR